MRSLKILSRLTFLCFLTTATSAFAAEVYQTAAGEQVSPLEVFQDCDACPQMVALPLGQFQMGSPAKEAHDARIRFFANINVGTTDIEQMLRQAFVDLGIDPDEPEEGLRQFYSSGNVVKEQDPQYFANPFLHEVPAHPVTIDIPIAIGRDEVTRAQWAVCVKEGGCEKGQTTVSPAAYTACERSANCSPTPDSRVGFRRQFQEYQTDPQNPRTGVTYQDMLDYTAWLNSKVGAGLYRLPTEAEWEYAARAGTTTRFAQGDTLTLQQANFLVYRRDTKDGEYVWDYDLGSAHDLLPVDRLDAANGWGLRHMSGNASEMTSSCGEGPHRGLSTSSQYLAADNDRADCKRALKGGMYDGNVELARPARRVAMSNDHWSPTIGFRVVRDLVPASHAVAPSDTR